MGKVSQSFELPRFHQLFLKLISLFIELLGVLTSQLSSYRSTSHDQLCRVRGKVKG